MFKIIKIVQYVWLTIAGVALGIAVYKTITGDNDSAIYFGAITFVGGIMYYLNNRRYKKGMEQLKKRNG
jgi:hypothetical protein